MARVLHLRRGVMPSVLVVDDDADLRTGLRTLLEARGIDVVEASSLREATAMSRLYEPSLLLVDGMLPDGNGIEWISALRSEGTTTEVVFMSSFFAKGRWLNVLGKLGVRHRISKRETPIDGIAEIVARATPLRS